MREKPRVCLIDEDAQVRLGWEAALHKEAEFFSYADEDGLVAQAQEESDLLSSFDCVIVGRYFKNNSRDIFDSELIDTLRSQGVGAIFLNWQGYLTKEEIHAKFDGRLFNRYGVRWQTLRTRIQKLKSKRVAPKKPLLKIEPPLPALEPRERTALYLDRPERCQELLKQMARQAGGRHKEKLEYYAQHDQTGGIQLLEAIYNRLLTIKESTHNCPSRYINSSPVVAKSILQKTLYG